MTTATQVQTPVLITRNATFFEKNGRTFQSLVFEATFADGTKKVIRDLSRMKIEVTQWERDNVGNWVVMGKDECPLYYRDWSGNPTLGRFKKDYPRKISRG